MRGFAVVALLAVLFSPVSVYAQETTGSAGVTPDSPLWGVDVALDQIRLALARGDEGKARVGLRIAEERLLEVRASIEAGDVESAERAERAHGRTLSDVRVRVRAIEDDPEDELETVVELEKEVEEHDAEVEETRERLDLRIRIRGELTPEQQARLQEFLDSMENSTGNVRVDIREKKGDIRVRFRARGFNDTEINDRFNETEREHLEEFFKVGAEERIANAEGAIAGAKEAAAALEANTTNQTAHRLAAGLHLIERAEFHLSVSKEAFAEAQYGRAYGQATASWRIARNAERILRGEVDEEEGVEEADEVEERHREKIKIEIEIEGNTTHVEVEIERDGVEEEVEFDVASTDRDVIITEIDERTSLTREELEEMIGADLTIQSEFRARFERRAEERRRLLEERFRQRVRVDIDELEEELEEDEDDEEDENRTGSS